MSVQLFAKLQGSQEYINLDLSASEPIKMVLSVANIEDPLSTTSSFSRTFKVPHTGINGPYFKGVFNVNSVDFDAARRADAYIMDNGQFFANGQIILNAIYRNEKEKNVEYEITFLGETSDFGAKIGGGFMNEINMNHLNHAKDYPNIVNSWNNGLFNGDVVYGLIEWGYTYNANNQPVQPTLSNGFQKSFTNTNNPLRLSQWKPQYRAKALWDQIFKEAGYTYDSTFLNSNLFKKLYIISDNVSAAELNTANTFEVTNNGGQDATWGVTELEYSVKVSDPGNNFNIATDVFVAPVTGLYEFTYQGDAGIGDYYQPYSSFADGSIEWVDQNGTVLASIQFQLYNQGYSNWSQNNFVTNIFGTTQINLNAGDIIKTRMVVLNPGNEYIALWNSSWTCTIAPQVLSATGILPANIKKIDFMKSIINRFRLVFVPSRDIQNHFTITPWKDWILEGTTKDWTNKLDDSKDLKIRPLFYGQKRFQVYKDQEDADYLNYNYQLTYKQTFGQLNFDSNNELLTGSKEYKDQFAPTPIAPIGVKEGDVNGSRFLIPHIAKDTGSTDDTVGTTVITGKREPIQPKLRLVFYNGVVAAPVTWWMAASDDAQQKVSWPTYPLMSQYSTWPIINGQTVDLNWKNEAPFWKVTDTALGNGVTELTSYSVYWKTWNDQVFDPYSRIVEANITLDYQDVLDLKFNDYIFLKDSWYVVNKVVDYIPGQTTNCRVELVKLGNIGVTIPYVSPVVYEPVSLCYSSDAEPCQVFCCNNQVTGQNIYYKQEGITFEDATYLYQDQNGQIPVPAGIYSDGISINEYDSIGILVNTYDPSLCNCNTAVYSFDVFRSKTACDLCCGNGGIPNVVWGLNPVFEANTLLWNDAALTIPVTNGWYIEVGGTTVQQWLNGTSTVAYNCNSCNCLEVEVFPHEVKFNPTQVCKACRCGLTIGVWTDNPNWNASTKIWANNIGTLPAAAGFYNKSGWYLETNGIAGDVINSNTCPSCLPCKPKVEIPIEIIIQKLGYSTTVNLESSLDSGLTWTNEGSISIMPNEGVLEKTGILGVEDGSIFRITGTSDILNGEITSELTVDGATDTFKSVSPGSTRIVYDVLVKPEMVMSYRMEVTGGEELPVSNLVLIGGNYNQYKGTGYPPSNTELRGIIGLNPDGSVNTDFNIGDGGLKDGSSTGLIWDIKRVGEQYLISGQFTQYKNVDCTNGLVLLNPDGSIDENFNSTVGAPPQTSPDNPVGRWVEEYNGIAYIGGEFLYWDKAPLGSTTPDLYTASPRMVALNISDGSINTGFTAEFTTSLGVDIEVIKVYEGKLYVGGNMQIYGADTRKWLYRLNLDGTLDTSFDATHLGGGVTDIEFDGDYIWVATSGTGRLKKILKSDGSAITWGPATKFNSPIEAISLVGDLLYVVGNFTTYDGTTINRIAALDKIDGSLYTTFDVGTGLNGNARNLAVTSTHLYVTGDFTTYNGDVANRIVKIDMADGTRDTSFDTGTGFNGITIGLLVGSNEQPEVWNCNLRSLSYSSESACDAFCNYDSLASDYWINSPDLITASLILNNTQCGVGGNGNPAGWYSDGSIVVYVGADGVILNAVTTANCNCTVTQLYRFKTTFAADQCDACCNNGTTTTVWSDTPIFSESNNLYADELGSSFVANGYYVNGGIVLLVIDNGVVATYDFCQCDCPVEDCASYRIRNISGEVISYVYTDCIGNFVFGELDPYTSINTSCAQLNKIIVTGNATVILNAIC
jgi:hypothetical protein